MRKQILATLVATFISVASAGAQTEPENHHSEKVSSLDAIIANLYEVISGEKGEPRDWEVFGSLFHPEAKLIPAIKDEHGKTFSRFMTPQEYIDSSGKWLVENGFFEKEIHRVTERFGPVAHIFSTYESYRSKKDSEPFMRGINSIQLMFDGDRWWILNISWSSETPEDPIPKAYLPGS
jgi:hypothetical protein